MKANKDMTRQEFDFSYAIKKAIHRLNYVEMEIESAKNVGMQGVSKGALIVAENEVSILKAALYNALKTVGT